MTEKLQEFIEINQQHPTIKFTYELSYSNLSFLDVKVSINNGRISTDLYVQPTDAHQYLLSSSCHTKHTKTSITYSLALRLRRICSNDHSFNKRKDELTNYLTNRGYKRKFITTKINKASIIPRHTALQQTQKRINDRTRYVTTYKFH